MHFCNLQHAEMIKVCFKVVKSNVGCQKVTYIFNDLYISLMPSFYYLIFLKIKNS